MDYYIGKTRRESIDPSVLPDGEKMSIVRRCIWLAEYIDRAGGGVFHGGHMFHTGGRYGETGVSGIV